MGLLSLFERKTAKDSERQAMEIVLRAFLRVRHLVKTNTYHLSPAIGFLMILQSA